MCFHERLSVHMCSFLWTITRIELLFTMLAIDDGHMQKTILHSTPLASSPSLPEEDKIRSDLARLQSQLHETQNRLLQHSRTTAPSHPSLHSLEKTKELAVSTRQEVNKLRKELVSLSNRYENLQKMHAEIRRRQHALQSLKATLLHLHRIHVLSQTIQSAQDIADHAHMSQACILFESLTSSHPLFDERYKSLHPIGERVAHAVAHAMRLLRTSLRDAALKCDSNLYFKCMEDFNKLGARKQFAQHVLQIFEEEGELCYSEGMKVEGKSSTRVIAVLSMLRNLVEKFMKIIEYHVRQTNSICQKVGKELARRKLPFDIYGDLSIKCMEENRFGILNEQSTTCLYLLQAVHDLSNEMKLGRIQIMECLSRKTGLSYDVKNSIDSFTQLRRRRSSFKGLSEDGIEVFRTYASLRAFQRKFGEEELRKALKRLALDFLSTCHLRHAEELQMITESPESWIRIRMNENDLETILSDLFSGIECRLTTSNTMESNIEERESSMLFSGSEYEEMNCVSTTFTTASLAMMRWVSEYATIGMTVPEIFSDSLSDITDIFLIFVYASVEMKSRFRTVSNEPLLKKLEDLLLERPKDKGIIDFISFENTNLFNTFSSRYGENEMQVTGDIGHSKERWGHSSQVSMPSYSQVSDKIYRDSSISELFIIRQCVASEGIGTFCDVLDRFISYIEGNIYQTHGLKGNPLKIGSLRSAISLGRDVQKAFYKLLSWDIVGGWHAISAVAETYRSVTLAARQSKSETTSSRSSYVTEMIERIRMAYVVHELPPLAAEQLGVELCEAGMLSILEGVSRVRNFIEIAEKMQILLDISELDMELMELTGLHPCPGRIRTEKYVKAAFMNLEEKQEWIRKYRRKFSLTERHIDALLQEYIQK